MRLPETGPGSDALTACAERWLESMAVRRVAERTRQLRRSCLRAFLEWALEREVRRADDVTRPLLEAYQRAVHAHRRKDGRPLSWGVQRERLRCLMAWFSWLTRQNVILHNPASELELPRPERRLPVIGLTREEVARLLAVPAVADPLGLRDRAMLEVFYATGLRRAELARLECADLNLGRGTLTVRQGKGGKDRVVPLGACAAAWVARYLDEVRPRLCVMPGEPGLFLTGYGERFNPDVLTRMMTAWLKAADLAGRGSCHLLRHTCATHMLEGGADVRYIQQLLGHANLETTAIYTEVTIHQLLAVHARCHPGAPLPEATQTAS